MTQDPKNGSPNPPSPPFNPKNLLHNYPSQLLKNTPPALVGILVAAAMCPALREAIWTFITTFYPG